MTNERLESLHEVVWGSRERFKKDASGAYTRSVSAWLEAKLEWSEYEDFALVQRQGGPCVLLAPLQAYIVMVLKDGIDGGGEAPQEGSGNAPPEPPDNEDPDEGLDDNVACIFTTSRTQRPAIIQAAVLKIFDNLGNPPQLVDQLENDNSSNLTIGQWIDLLFQPGGLLLLLYSIVKTKTATAIQQEIGYLADAVQLIEPVNGHGEQALINLLLFGTATTNVFDGLRDLGDGMMLNGITEKSKIGFLSMHEAFRYVEVGDNYKKPKYPIWIMSSESHYTVFWTNFPIITDDAVEAGKQRQQMRQTLLQFDSGGGFFEADKLTTVLLSCELMNDKEYVDIVAPELDPDGLGIIMINTFLDFFCDTPSSGADPTEEHAQVGKCFDIYHYNGRIESNPEGKIKFRAGKAMIVDFMPPGLGVNGLEQILQTKWPNIQIEWDDVRVNDVNFLPRDY